MNQEMVASTEMDRIQKNTQQLQKQMQIHAHKKRIKTLHKNDRCYTAIF